ncbi:MAG TPA: type II toxin-antitoxin system VapC family toxin [Caulobacteraceae bacterium]|jgi:predicted nucleic acid-binding protein
MVKPLFDTNILIDFLNGIEAAKSELARYEDPAISIISWMEVMAGASESDKDATRAFLSGFQRIGLDESIAEAAVALRQSHRVKLPDAIVWASAQVHGRLLVTRNERDFPTADPGVRMPYRL